MPRKNKNGSCGKVVIVAGNQGFGGIVTPDNVRKLRYCNLSGRGANKETTGDNLAESVIPLLIDDELRRSLELFSRNFAEEFDSRKLAQSLEQIYFDALGTHRSIEEAGPSKLEIYQ